MHDACIDHGRRGDRDGYTRIHRNGNWYSPHRLVCYMSTPGIALADDTWQACHLCDNPRCIRVEHLVAGTRSFNLSTRDQRGARNPKTHLTDDDVRQIRQWRAEGERIMDIAYHYGMSVRAVSAIVNRESWTHVTD